MDDAAIAPQKAYDIYVFFFSSAELDAYGLGLKSMRCGFHQAKRFRQPVLGDHFAGLASGQNDRANALMHAPMRPHGAQRGRPDGQYQGKGEPSAPHQLSLAETH